jgi:hypothetical protein
LFGGKIFNFTPSKGIELMGIADMGMDGARIELS